MAGGSLLALLDDIASVLDDVSVMTKVAAKKTSGVIGDDLALNAEQVSGVKADRELPVIWAVAKGSALNKLILVPVALLLSAFIPSLITPLLVLGGLFLCFEGVEKLFHKKESPSSGETLVLTPEEEQQKIKGAIRTDFILSAEIIVIALGTVAGASISDQAMVVSIIAAAITVGVYGLVAFIVKLDDIGLYLLQKTSRIAQTVGRSLLGFCPILMKTLSVVGTIAMFIVGGGILVHSFSSLHHWLVDLNLPYFALFEVLYNIVIGLLAGSLILASKTLISKLR